MKEERIKDRDVYALKVMDKAIRNCTCRRMMKANLDYLYDKYVIKGKAPWNENEINLNEKQQEA